MSILANYRPFKIYINLPSKFAYYDDDVIDKSMISIDGKIGVKSMTTTDELSLSNVDGLFSGRSVTDAIKNCVPAIKDPNKLLSNDSMVIVSAIHAASYGKTTEITVECPECSEESTYDISYENFIYEFEELEPEYKLDLDGFFVYLRPYTFEEVTKCAVMYFQQAKIKKIIESNSVETEDALDQLKDVFQRMTELTTELTTNSIIAVEGYDEKGDLQRVTDKEDIRVNFVNAMIPDHAKKISDKINEINKVGMKTTQTVKCGHCEHEHTINDINVDPSSFLE